MEHERQAQEDSRFGGGVHRVPQGPRSPRRRFPGVRTRKQLQADRQRSRPQRAAAIGLLAFHDSEHTAPRWKTRRSKIGSTTTARRASPWTRRAWTCSSIRTRPTFCGRPMSGSASRNIGCSNCSALYSRNALCTAWRLNSDDVLRYIGLNHLGWELQIPSFKLQTNTKFQVPKPHWSKTEFLSASFSQTLRSPTEMSALRAFGAFPIGACLGFGAWSLCFGARRIASKKVRNRYERRVILETSLGLRISPCLLGRCSGSGPPRPSTDRQISEFAAARPQGETALGRMVSGDCGLDGPAVPDRDRHTAALVAGSRRFSIPSVLPSAS